MIGVKLISIDRLELLVKELSEFQGENFLAISTNKFQGHNGFICSSLKYSDHSAFLQVIIYDYFEIEKLSFLGKADFNFVLQDTELKNKILNLGDIIAEYFPNLKIIRYGSNDVTLFAFDLFLSTKILGLGSVEASIYGAGYLGTEIALKLAKRGVTVNLVTTNPSLINSKLSSGYLQHITDLVQIRNYQYDLTESDIHIGCTSGVSVIQAPYIQKKVKSSLLLDVGGNNFTTGAQRLARENNNTIYSLSNDEAMFAWISAYFQVSQQFASDNLHKFSCGHTYIPKGRLLQNGDVLVSNLPNPRRIYGIYEVKTGEFSDFFCPCKKQIT